MLLLIDFGFAGWFTFTFGCFCFVKDSSDLFDLSKAFVFVLKTDGVEIHLLSLACFFVCFLACWLISRLSFLPPALLKGHFLYQRPKKLIILERSCLSCSQALRHFSGSEKDANVLAGCWKSSPTLENKTLFVPHGCGRRGKAQTTSNFLFLRIQSLALETINSSRSNGNVCIPDGWNSWARSGSHEGWAWSLKLGPRSSGNCGKLDLTSLVCPFDNGSFPAIPHLQTWPLLPPDGWALARFIPSSSGLRGMELNWKGGLPTLPSWAEIQQGRLFESLSLSDGGEEGSCVRRLR